MIVDKEQGWDREVPREIFDMMVEEVGRRYPTKRPLLNILRDALKRELFYTEWHTIDSGYQLELLQEVRNLYVRIREWEKLNGTRRKRPLQSFLVSRPRDCSPRTDLRFCCRADLRTCGTDRKSSRFRRFSGVGASRTAR